MNKYYLLIVGISKPNKTMQITDEQNWSHLAKISKEVGRGERAAAQLLDRSHEDYLYQLLTALK